MFYIKSNLLFQIAAALNLGWWVFTTDYEGLNAEFTVGLQTGHAVLDSTRAVLSAGPSVGLSSDPVYALSNRYSLPAPTPAPVGFIQEKTILSKIEPLVPVMVKD